MHVLQKAGNLIFSLFVIMPRERRETVFRDFVDLDALEASFSPVDPGVHIHSHLHDELINKNFIPLDDMEPGDNSHVFVTDLPNQTSQWRKGKDIVHKVFKVRKCLFDVETIFWPDDKEGINLNTWFEKYVDPRPPSIGAVYEEYLKFMDKVLENLDIDTSNWYKEQSQEDLINKAQTTFSAIRHQVKSFRTADLPTNVSSRIADHKPKVLQWLATLKDILEKEHSTWNEMTFMECFRDLVEMANLRCQSGTMFSKLRFSYTYTTKGTEKMWQVSSEPDFILYSIDENGEKNCLAVVEVKQEKVAPPKDESQSSTPQAESSEDDFAACDAHLLKVEYVNGNPRQLTKMEEKMTDVFLHQLLGEVAATASSPFLGLKEVSGVTPGHRSVLGIGVVGFKVYFVNFICLMRREFHRKRKWSLHEIPVTRGVGMDVLIAEPLDMLKREDRKLLIRALFAMKTLRYDDWYEK